MRTARPRCLILSAVLAALAGAPAGAQSPEAAPAAPAALPSLPSLAGYAPPDYIRRPPAMPRGWTGRRPRALTLAEAREIALRGNLDLAFERETVRVVDTNRSFALGGFEPTLSLGGGHSVSQQPPLNLNQGLHAFPITIDSWGLSATQTLPSGTSLNLSFLNLRTDSGAANALSPLLYNSSLLLTLTQQLLQGFSLDGRVQWAPVLRARCASQREREGARLLAMQAVKQTEDGYWSLVQTWKAYEVALGMLERAERQFDLTRRKIAAGIQPESEQIGAEATLAQRRVDVVTWEAQIEVAADALRQLLHLPADQWEQPLQPLDSPSFERVTVSFDAAWERAVAARPELRQVQIDKRGTALDLEVARNSRLPQLALQGTAGTVGQDPDYGRTLGQVGSRAGWLWGVNLNASWAPLGVAARAGVRRQQAILRQRDLSREQVLTQIRVDVRGAIRHIGTAELKLTAAAEYRRVAEHNLDIAMRRFQSGLPGSGNQEISLKQTDLATAQQTELQALIDHQKARTELQMAMGELLEARQLRFEVAPGG